MDLKTIPTMSETEHSHINDKILEADSCIKANEKENCDSNVIFQFNTILRFQEILAVKNFFFDFFIIIKDNTFRFFKII